MSRKHKGISLHNSEIPVLGQQHWNIVNVGGSPFALGILHLYGHTLVSGQITTDMKKICSSLPNIPFFPLCLSLRNDEKTAADYKIQGGSVLHLVLALRGGEVLHCPTSLLLTL